MDYIYILKLIGTAFGGILLGAISTIPIGAVQLQVIKKALSGHVRAAVLTACGSATSDFIYGILTLFGFSYLLRSLEMQVVTYSFGILVLAFILIKMYRERHVMVHQPDRPVMYHGRMSFFSGFTIAISNPGMVVWWILWYRFFLDLHLFDPVTAGIKLLFIISGCVGLGGYLIFISLFVNKMKKSFSDTVLYRANMFIISLLGILIIFFVVKLVSAIFNFDIGIGSGI